MQRPSGVSIIAVFMYFCGAFVLVGSLLIFADSPTVARIAGNTSVGSSIANGIGIAIGMIFLILAAICGAAGYGLWLLKSWARVITIILAWLFLVSDFSDLLGTFFRVDAHSLPPLLLQICWLGIDVCILWYMYQPEVRSVFGPKT